MIRAIVIGASNGGMEAIKVVLSGLPDQFTIPVIIVLHIGSNNINHYLALLNSRTSFLVKEAAEKEPIAPNTVYFAAPNYHLQVESNLTFSLSTDSKVNYSRPSIDVLFETAAWAYKDKLVGILLSGSNSDGAQGMKTIQKYGGITIVEDPASAYSKTMPRAAVELFTPDYVLDIQAVAPKLGEICSGL